jgi:hypothetical protein
MRRSNLDSSFSSDASFTDESDSSSQEDKSDPVVLLRKVGGTRTEKRVCEALSKHLILDIFFEVNKM